MHAHFQWYSCLVDKLPVDKMWLFNTFKLLSSIKIVRICLIIDSGIIGLNLFVWPFAFPAFCRRLSIPRGGGGFFHSKGTWGCAASKGILFRTSSLAKGVLFGNFSRVKSRQGYAFLQFWSEKCQNSVLFLNLGPENAKIWQVLSRKCQFRALLKEKLV